MNVHLLLVVYQRKKDYNLGIGQACLKEACSKQLDIYKEREQSSVWLYCWSQGQYVPGRACQISGVLLRLV